MQLPASLKLEPSRFAMGALVEMSAGTSLEDTAVCVINGQGKKVNNGHIAGKKMAFTIVQRLWRLDATSGTCKIYPACSCACSHRIAAAATLVRVHMS